MHKAENSFAIVPHQAPQKRAAKNEGEITPQDITTLIQAGVIPTDCPPAQIKIFAQVCKESRLSPFRKQIAIMGFWTKATGGMVYSIVITNDGLRAMINRTGCYGGCEPTTFNNNLSYFDMQTLIEKEGIEQLRTCTFVAYFYDQRGNKNRYPKTIAVKEFSAGSKNFNWGKMPLQMAEKVAKSFAYKEMLGDEMGGFVTDAEIHNEYNDAPNTAAEITETKEGENMDYEAQQLCNSATSQTELKELVSVFKKKHDIENLQYFPITHKMFLDRLAQLSQTGVTPQ